jgi:hypothetical protein
MYRVSRVVAVQGQLNQRNIPWQKPECICILKNSPDPFEVQKNPVGLQSISKAEYGS